MVRKSKALGLITEVNNPIHFAIQQEKSVNIVDSVYLRSKRSDQKKMIFFFFFHPFVFKRNLCETDIRIFRLQVPR